MALKVADYVGSDATRGNSPVHGAFVGSVTQSPLRVAPCPVLAVPPIERLVDAQGEAQVATVAD
jgi:hypothetical protein